MKYKLDKVATGLNPTGKGPFLQALLYNWVRLEEVKIEEVLWEEAVVAELADEAVPGVGQLVVEQHLLGLVLQHRHNQPRNHKNSWKAMLALQN